MQTRSFLSIGLCLAFHGALAAQPFFYHADQDKNAQLAVSTAKEIANGTLFDKETQNLNALSAIEIQRVFSFAQVQFKAGVGAFTSWKDVSDQLNRIETNLKPGAILTEGQAAARIAEVEEKVKTVTASIKKLSDAAGADSDVVKEIQGQMKNAGDALDYAKTLPVTNQKFSGAIENVKQGLDTATSIYDAFATAYEARKNIQGNLAKLNTSPEADELKLLSLELQHLQWIAQNSARRDLEAGDVMALVAAARTKFSSAQLANSTESIEITLDRLATAARTDSSEDKRIEARKTLFMLLIALHEATAARAEADLPEKLAELRDTQEEARYSILTSSAHVQSSEVEIQNAVARLALYYQGGIKPAQLAQLLYNLSGLVSLPTIAAK
jgi:hypothetical protein